MKPPFDSSGGSTPLSKSTPAIPSPLPGGLPSVPGMPAMPDLPDLPDIPEIPELELPNCLPGTCDALWNAIDKGMAPALGAIDDVMKKAGEAKDAANKTFDEAKNTAAKAIDDAKEAVRQNVEMAKKYAQIYQNDAKQAWAGLQSVITQQAGCALKDAAALADKIAPGATDQAKAQVGKYVDQAGNFVDDKVAQAAQKVDDMGQAAADKARGIEKAATDFGKQGMDKVADTKKKAFETLYAPAKFAQDNGLDKLAECGSIPGRPETPAALMDALETIDQGTDEAIRAGSDMIAQYEQNSVVEQAIYEAQRYRDEGLNELATMTDSLKSAITDAIPLSDQCGGPPIPFDDSLLDPGAPERYYNKLMNEFEKMGKDAKDKMIDEIAKQPVPGMPTPPSAGTPPASKSLPGMSF